MRQQLDRITKKFSNTIESLDEAIDNQTNSIRDELTQARTKLQDEVRVLRGQVFEELERRFSMMREDKLSKDDMAEFFFEIGMRMKGNEFIPQLKEAVETDVYATDVRFLEEGKNW